jgi:hypothetical protein
MWRHCGPTFSQDSCFLFQLVADDSTLNITSVHRYTQGVFFGLGEEGTKPHPVFTNIIKETFQTTRSK